jgi:hypothetical protein
MVAINVVAIINVLNVLQDLEKNITLTIAIVAQVTAISVFII